MNYLLILLGAVIGKLGELLIKEVYNTLKRNKSAYKPIRHDNLKINKPINLQRWE
jgi:hypothetical protein